MKNGHTKSCGCLHIETAINRCKEMSKYNKYDMSQEYGIGFASNTNSMFLFDKEDYEKICNYCWYENDQGYVIAHNKNGQSKNIRIHRLIMGLKDFNFDNYIDHINHNKMDNRKINLRIVTNQQNCFNHKIALNNTSGTTGVYWSKLCNKWAAQIAYNQNVISLGTYDNIEDAIVARKNAEDKYFNEYSYRKSMEVSKSNDIS